MAVCGQVGCSCPGIGPYFTALFTTSLAADFYRLVKNSSSTNNYKSNTASTNEHTGTYQPMCVSSRGNARQPVQVTALPRATLTVLTAAAARLIRRCSYLCQRVQLALVHADAHKPAKERSRVS